MPEEAKKVTKDDFQDLRDKIGKKKGSDKQKVIQQIATRDKLERDYKEDLLSVVFYSSPETQRMVKARRPNQSQMITIMRLSAEAAVYEGQMDAKSLDKMVKIYEDLNKLAADLTVDKNLNEEFWKTKVSFTTLQNFITSLITATQQGPVTEGEMESFR